MAGVCQIKKEFIISREVPPTEKSGKVDNDKPDETSATTENSAENSEPQAKKPRLSNREWKKQKKGQNKARPLPYKVDRVENLCQSLYNGPTEEKCKSGDGCKFVHDIQKFMANKPEDIGPTCHIYSTKGFCPRGLTCRFAKAHINDDLSNRKQDFYDENAPPDTVNQIGYDLQVSLRKKTYDFAKSKAIVKDVQLLGKSKGGENASEDKLVGGCCKETPAEEIVQPDEAPKRHGFSSDCDLIKERSCEKKKVDFRDKLLLSPLTTVGNLPFRRICKEFGADITCGEMACALPIINGASQEWALAKRHKSEDVFGVQLCGNNAELISYAAQVLNERCEIDYVDLNIGCPIDLIFQQGGGSALIRRPNVLETIVRSCTKVLDIPFTVKTRTGIHTNKNVAHELVPKFEEWGAQAVTVHGRTREQRYTRSSDWAYIEQCASRVKNIPVVGNGDILSYEDFVEVKKTAPHVSSVMLGRGALIKPWIFKEIKEQKSWDPSSKERLEIVQKYINYGLEHWGSDTKGVENTRRFFLEWQSFLHRYVPYGLLENPPQKINERPSRYRGRDDPETLLASDNCADWIKLSEMYLGPVPDGFNFLPKHKANSY